MSLVAQCRESSGCTIIARSLRRACRRWPSLVRNCGRGRDAFADTHPRGQQEFSLAGKRRRDPSPSDGRSNLQPVELRFATRLLQGFRTTTFPSGMSLACWTLLDPTSLSFPMMDWSESSNYFKGLEGRVCTTCALGGYPRVDIGLAPLAFRLREPLLH